jgi:hypothetical protein
VPRAIVLAIGASVSVAGAVVVFRLALSQPLGPPAYETVTDNPLSVPRPPFETTIDCDGAVPMLWVAVKPAVGDEREMSAAGTTNVTGILNGVFVADAAVIGTFAV